MLTPAHVRDIQNRVLGVFDEKAEKDLTTLLRDRAEIAAELERIQRGRVSGNWPPHNINTAITALIERIKTMTPEQLNRLTPEEREAWEMCEKATPGPWFEVKISRAGRTVKYSKFPFDVPDGLGCFDQDFLNHARTALPEALRKLAELRAVVAEAPCSEGCVSDQFGHAEHCWKSRLPK